MPHAGITMSEPQIHFRFLAYWQDPANTIDVITLIEAERRNREREEIDAAIDEKKGTASSAPTVPTVVEQLQAAIKEFETNTPNSKEE